MAAIDDAISAIGVMIGRLEETKEAHQTAVGQAESAMSTAEMLGADGVIDAVSAVQVRLDELATVLSQAATLADEALNAAQSAKT